MYFKTQQENNTEPAALTPATLEVLSIKETKFPIKSSDGENSEGVSPKQWGNAGLSGRMCWFRPRHQPKHYYHHSCRALEDKWGILRL